MLPDLPDLPKDLRAKAAIRLGRSPPACGASDRSDPPADALALGPAGPQNVTIA